MLVRSGSTLHIKVTCSRCRIPLSHGQVDLLRNVQTYFRACVNGKATLTGEEDFLPTEKHLSCQEWTPSET